MENILFNKRVKRELRELREIERKGGKDMHNIALKLMKRAAAGDIDAFIIIREILGE
ncbi:MAG: hypothetical protein FWF23_03635 [Alphaproteobacteria bacterium]|nr:hypothetical protein [Alphaproteobacteria bacterium]MCL2505846.1 hypothetical protein [Alphaproteobacteria bacterium]